MDFARLGPFKIVRILGPIIYKLELPDRMKITRIRYISVLKLADLEASFIENIPNIDPKS